MSVYMSLYTSKSNHSMTQLTPNIFLGDGKPIDAKNCRTNLKPVLLFKNNPKSQF